MRYVLALLVLLALQFAPGSPVIAQAQAQEFGCNSTSTGPSLPSCASREQAYNECMIAANAYPSELVACETYGAPNGYQCYGTSFRPCSPATGRYFPFPGDNGGCPAGTAWNEGSKTCFSSQQCLAHNEEPGFKNVGEVTRGFQQRCVGGCNFEIQSPYSYTSAGGTTFYTGEYMFTGDACAAETPTMPEPEAQEKSPQECVPAGNDASGTALTFCVKANGNQCFTGGSSSTQICWTPGEVGEKGDGPVLQKRNAGNTALPPSTTPPEGSTLSPSGSPMTSTTTVNNTTITTTIQNYRTDTGVNATPNQSGEPADGTGGTDPKDSEGGSVVGGEGCDTPPVVTGDPILANIVLQTWGTRCAAEAANAVKATGDIESCASPFTVTGPEDDPNTHKLRAIRKQFCPDEEDTHPEGAAGDYGTGTDPDEGSIQGQVFGTGTEVGADGLDDSGFGWTRTCPQMPIIEVMGATLDFNLPEMCDWMKLGGQLVLILAAMGSLRLMAPGV